MNRWEIKLINSNILHCTTKHKPFNSKLFFYNLNNVLDIKMSGMLDGVCGFGDGIDACCWLFPMSIAPAAPSTPIWFWLPPFIQSCSG